MNESNSSKSEEYLEQLSIRSRQTLKQFGIVALQENGSTQWYRTAPNEAVYWKWEDPIPGCRYLLSVDTMSGTEAVTGSREHDNHAALLLRDAYTDQHGVPYPVMLVARIVPPCQWETAVLTRWAYLLARYYGNATIVVEASAAGIAMLNALNTEPEYRSANLFQRPEFDRITQKTTLKLGWQATEPSRRAAINKLQQYVREEWLEVLCPHVVSEMQTLVINAKGKAEASGRNHDDSIISMSIGLECLPSANQMAKRGPVEKVDPNLAVWRVQ